jgi:predicted Zn-dependent protease
MLNGWRWILGLMVFLNWGVVKKPHFIVVWTEVFFCNTQFYLKKKSGSQ